MTQHHTPGLAFITPEVRQAVAAIFSIPIVVAIGGWLLFSESLPRLSDDYHQQATPGSVVFVPSEPAEVSVVEAFPIASPSPPTERSNSPEPQPSQPDRTPQIAADDQPQERRAATPPPTPPSTSRLGRGASAGEAFPTYRFATLDNALQAARNQKGVFVLQDQQSKLLMRLGPKFDANDISPTPDHVDDQSTYSKRMVRLSRLDHRIDAFVQAASSLCGWPVGNAELFVVFPKIVDQQIQAEQRRALSLRGLTTEADVDMIVTYRPGWSHPFTVNVFAPTAANSDTNAARPPSWQSFSTPSILSREQTSPARVPDAQ